MTISKIVNLINTQLAGELLIYSELEPFLDEVIDDINNELDAKFPMFSDFNATDYPGEEDEDGNIVHQYPNYDFFPEKYIREVVIKGAAYKWYVMDEEGIPTAQMYQYNYQDQIFLMLRDYLEDIPREYREHHKASVPTGYNDVAWKEPWIRHGYI